LLAQQILDVGATVQFVVAYSRHSASWSDAQLDIAKKAATDGGVWCFSSSQAVLYLQALLPDVRWDQSRCVTTHARIAQTARDVGFVKIVQTRPVLSDRIGLIRILGMTPEPAILLPQQYVTEPRAPKNFSYDCCEFQSTPQNWVLDACPLNSLGEGAA
jgi:hypothetical protein